MAEEAPEEATVEEAMAEEAPEGAMAGEATVEEVMVEEAPVGAMAGIPDSKIRDGPSPSVRVPL